MHRLLPVLVVAVLAACQSAASPPSLSPTRPCLPSVAPEAPAGLPATVQPPPLQLTTVATGLDQPTGILNACDGTNRLFVLEKTGAIRIIEPSGQLRGEPFLDLTSRVATVGESGLLGMAFHPEYATNGRFFVHYTDLDNDTVLAEYRVSEDNPNVADLSVEVTMLTVDQPERDHKGGQLAFGPDGMLYVGLGDGGGSVDPHANGQNRGTRLSKILRIDVESVAPEIPPDNPWADGGGAREMWAWGLRNPWRFSFDPVGGDLFIGDVGAGGWEEINRQDADSAGGENYGWSDMEGPSCRIDECADGAYVLPIAAYRHDPACAVVGGYVYRGADPALWGTYLYGDFCSGQIWGFDAAAREPAPVVVAESGRIISSFGVDEAGELYVADYGGGEILRVESGPAPS